MVIRILVFVISIVGIANAENLWKKHLDGELTLPPAIMQQERNPKRQQALAKKHYILKKQRKKLKTGFFHKIFGTNKDEIEKLDKEISETKKAFFKYKSKRRFSNKQRKALRR